MATYFGNALAAVPRSAAPTAAVVTFKFTTTLRTFNNMRAIAIGLNPASGLGLDCGVDLGG